MINRVTLVGRVGNPIEVRRLDNSRIVASFTFATDETYKDKNGNKVTDTTWHNIQCWGKLAEIGEKYVKKGDLLYLEGKIVNQTWEKDGTKHYKTLIEIDTLKMLGGKKPEAGQSQAKEPIMPPEYKPEPTDDLPF